MNQDVIGALEITVSALQRQADQLAQTMKAILTSYGDDPTLDDNLALMIEHLHDLKFLREQAKKEVRKAIWQRAEVKEMVVTKARTRTLEHVV